MRINLQYSVKSFIELPQEIEEFSLSPFDLESIIAKGFALQPRISLDGIHGDTWIGKSSCEREVFINKDRAICNPLAGFSHEKFGVALTKNGKKFRVEGGDGLKLEGEKCSYMEVPGAIIISIYEKPYAHIVTSDYLYGLNVYERAYRGEPRSASAGYRAYTTIYADGRSQIFWEGKIEETGMLAQRALRIQNSTFVLSSRWLVRLEEDLPRPLVFLGEEADFLGLINEQPVFMIGGAPYRLEEASLIPLRRVGKLSPSASISIYDIAVVSLPGWLTVYDEEEKEILKVSKGEDSWCWAVRKSVFCCTRGLCGEISEGSSQIFVNAENSEERDRHSIVIDTEVPVVIDENGEERLLRPGENAKISRSDVSIFEPYIFDVRLRHILGAASAPIPSSPRKIKLEAEARVFESTGIHECGRPFFLEVEVLSLEAPMEIRLFIEGKEVKRGEKLELCLEELPDFLHPRAFDPVTQRSIELDPLIVNRVFVHEPSLGIEIEHHEGRSEILLKTNAEEVRGKLICSNREFGLKIPKSLIENCQLPAYFSLELRKNGFIYQRRKDIVIEDLDEDIVKKLKNGENESRIGGFLIRYYASLGPSS
ncbi:MAG: hypothetical protein QW765_05280 [Fervidicoccaceae archaeon]